MPDCCRKPVILIMSYVIAYFDNWPHNEAKNLSCGLDTALELFFFLCHTPLNCCPRTRENPSSCSWFVWPYFALLLWSGHEPWMPSPAGLCAVLVLVWVILVYVGHLPKPVPNSVGLHFSGVCPFQTRGILKKEPSCWIGSAPDYSAFPNCLVTNCIC